MDAILFTTNHGMEYAVCIKCLAAIVPVPEITAYPGVHESIVGIAKFREHIIPVFDTSIVYHGTRGPSNLMIVCEGKDGLYGLLIDKVGKIMRDNVPAGVRFIDLKDYMQSIYEYRPDDERFELF